MWLVCEEYNEARDNGYWLYKYIRKAHPEQDVVYAINKESVDYEKIKNLGEVIQYGSIKHWAYYLAASINISSQKGGKPNAAVCYLLEVYGSFKKYQSGFYSMVSLKMICRFYIMKIRRCGCLSQLRQESISLSVKNLVIRMDGSNASE